MKKTVCIAMAVLAMAGGGVAYAVSGTAQDRPAATATAQKQTTFAIENMTCATCDAALVNDTITTDTGVEVQVSKCPDGHGMIKSPLCCGQDMSCQV